MKKKILALCLVVVLVVTAITGVTLAYFNDTTNVVTNTFTTGSIDLRLDEAKVEKNANGDYEAVDAGTRIADEQSYDLHPGQVIEKDPTLYLKTTGNDEAYVAAKVVITADLSKLYVENDEAVNFYDFVSGGVTYPAGSTITPYTGGNFDKNVKAWEVKNANGHDYYLTQLVESHKEEIKAEMLDENKKPVLDSEGNPIMETIGEKLVVDKVTMCYYFQKAQKNDAEIELFNTLKIPSDWNNDDMAKLNNMTIVVTGYAHQVESFEEGVLNAMAATFATELSVAAA